MPRQKRNTNFQEPNLDQGGMGPGPNSQHLPLGPGGPPDQFFTGRGPPGQPGSPFGHGPPGPPQHMNSAGSPFGPGGMQHHSQHNQFNHDFLDELIQPVTGVDHHVSGPNDGGMGPNHMYDGPSQQYLPPTSSIYSDAPMGSPYSRMPGPIGPSGSGKIYPMNQSMVFNPSNPNAPPIYPCGVCHKEVHDNDQAILCESGCNFWFHRACTGLSEPAFAMLKEEVYAEWVCDKCLSTKNIPLVKLKP